MKLLFACAFLLCAFAAEAMACSCRGDVQPCEAYGDASAVFVGTVTFSKSINVKRAGYDTTQRLVRFHVDRPIRNVKDSDIEIQTAFGEAACGYGFRLGGQYLVYAYSNHDKALETNICTRTRPLSDAAEDLEYFNGLSKAAPGGTISGEVGLRRPSKPYEYPWPPVKDVTILSALGLFLPQRARRFAEDRREEVQRTASGIQRGEGWRSAFMKTPNRPRRVLFIGVDVNRTNERR